MEDTIKNATHLTQAFNEYIKVRQYGILNLVFDSASTGAPFGDLENTILKLFPVSGSSVYENTLLERRRSSINIAKQLPHFGITS